MAGDIVSIVLPVHNEGRVIGSTLRRLSPVFDGIFSDYEIIISEDGSTDNTVNVLKDFRSKRIRVFHSDRRAGKGAAIRNAATYAKGRIIVFMDADLASEPSHVKELVEYIEKGAAIVIGSRYVKGSSVRRNPVRHVASVGFNLLVKGLLGSKLNDHQCGFKAFRKDLVLPLINDVEDGGWFWDTELLVRAQRKGLSVKEIPISWSEGEGSKFRIFQDSLKMACSLARFRLKNR